MKTAMTCLLAAMVCIPTWAQKGDKGGTGCTNLTGKLSLATDPQAYQIRPDSLGAYNATLFNCSGGSGDVVVTLPSGRTLTRDFSLRLPVSPTDDPAPSWQANNSVQIGSGGFSVGKVVNGYSAASGYAYPYPHASCWIDDKTPSASCNFTTGAGSNFTASDRKTYSLRWRNPSADQIANSTRTDYDITLDNLLNEEYPLALVKVTYLRGGTPALDAWEIEPVNTSGQSIASIFVSSKGSIQRYGYFNMHFKATLTR